MIPNTDTISIDGRVLPGESTPDHQIRQIVRRVAEPDATREDVLRTALVTIDATASMEEHEVDPFISPRYTDECNGVSFTVSIYRAGWYSGVFAITYFLESS